jgi:WD40 repeat protein
MLATRMTLAVALYAGRGSLGDAGRGLLDGKPLATLDGAGGTVVAYAADGLTIVTAGGNEAQLWDGHTFRPATEPLKHDQPVRSAALSSDGRLLLTAAGKLAILWDAKTGKQVRTLEHADRVFDACFSPDGKRAATACSDKSARIWDLDNGKQLVAFAHKHGVRFVEFGSDATRLLTGTVFTGVDPTKKHWKADNLIEVDDAYAPGDAWVWDVAGARKVASFVRGYATCRGRPVFSPDGRLVGVPAGGHGAAVLDVASDRIIAEWMFVCGVHGDTTVAFTGDGKRLLVVGDDGSSVLDAAAHVLELNKYDEPPKNDDETTHELREVQKFLPNQTLDAGVISPDGKTVAVAGTASGVWDVASGKRLVEPLVDHPTQRGDWWPSSVALSPSGDHVAIGFISKKWWGDRYVPAGPTYTAVWGIKRD